MRELVGIKLGVLDGDAVSPYVRSMEEALSHFCYFEATGFLFVFDLEVSTGTFLIRCQHRKSFHYMPKLLH